MMGRQLKLNDFFNARHVAMAMPSTSTAVDDPLPQPSPEAEAMEEPQPQVPPSPVGRPRVATHPRNTTVSYLINIHSVMILLFSLSVVLLVSSILIYFNIH